MKKFLSIMLSILMVVTMLPMAVLPASAAENLDYNIKLEVVDWAVYETSGKLIGEFNAVEHGDAFYDVSLTQADDGTFTCSYQIALERNDGNTAWNESSISFKIDSCEDEFMQEFEKSFYSSYNIFYNLKVTRSAGDSHTFKDATCVAPKTCAICGVTEGDIDATAHSWANLDGICANGCGLECTHENQTGSVCEICGEHICSYNNGFCTECDAYEPAELKDGYYQIKNGGNLFWYANYINTVDRTANAVLTANIDLENRPWTPIGSTGENSNNFRGIFDGQNYFIRGLYVEGGRAGLGFFGEVRTGTVKNFTIFGEVVVNTEVDYVGGVIGSICGVNGETDLERNGAIIQNINSYVNLTVKAHGVGKIGGFVGYANHQSLIEQCSWYGTFDAGEYRVDSGAGGFIGKIQENTSEVTIRNCGAYGTIKTNYAGDYNNTATIYMGGFLSFSNTNAQTTLENCLFAGRFERGENLTDQAFLGAFGTLRSVNAIKNCYYLGDDGLEAVHSDSNLKPGDNIEIISVTEDDLRCGTIATQLGEYWEQVEDYPRPKDTGSHSHSYTYTDNGDGTHDKVCLVCDYVVVYNEAHTPADNATYTDNNDGTHSFTCGDCGATVSDNHDFGSGNTCICGAEIAFTGIVVDDENSDEYRYDETRKTYTIIIPADEVGGIGYLSYDIIGTNLTLIEDTNTLLKVQHENEDGLTSAPNDLLVDVLQDNGYFGWSVLGYGDGEWEKLLYSNDDGMTWTTYTFEVKQAYSITVNASQNGTVTANEYAIEGDNIALNVSPAEGYMLDTLSVTDASGNSVDVENNAFTMPASAVTVTATFAVCDHKDGRHETATDNGDGTHDATYSCCGATVTEVPHTLDITTGKCSACGADMTVIATVTDGTNTYYAADAATLNQAVTAILETGSRTFTVELPADTEAEMITAIRRAICDTEGVADGSINLTLKGVTSIPGTTNWDGVAFGPGDIYDEAGEIVDQELVTQLASVNLPDATEIGAQAFYFCENLVTVSAPKAQTIGAQAFGYTALTSVEFPELTTIPTDMFSGTWTLSSAKFPKVTTIEQKGLLIGAKFAPENNPTPFPLELTAEGDITFNGSNHFNTASQNYSGKVDLVLCCDKKDAVTFQEDGTATWQVREDLSYTFKSITFKHSYTDGVCDNCEYACPHENETGDTCSVCGATIKFATITGVSINVDGVIYTSDNTSAENPAVINPDSVVTVTVTGENFDLLPTEPENAVIGFTYFSQNLECLYNNPSKFDIDTVNNTVSFPANYDVLSKAITASELTYTNDDWHTDIGSGVYVIYIDKKDIADTLITLDNTEFIYSGNPIEPTVLVMADGQALMEGEHYTLTFESNVNAGTASVTVKGIGDYTGEVTKDFTIIKAYYDLTAPTPNTLTYKGEELYLVSAGTVEGAYFEYSLDGVSWSTSIPQAKDVGNYTVYYRVLADENHYGIEGTVDVIIKECPHEWNDGVLTRPVYDAVLGSKDGYYTYTCTVCGEEKTETVKSADYSAYEAVSEEINALLQSDELTNAAKQAIYSAANECGHLSNDLTESEQNIVDDLVAELEKIVDTAEEKIASGEYVKIDGMKEYNKIADALDAELMENYSQEEFAALAEKAGDEINARLGEIIEKAEALTGSVAENKDALAEIESEMRALYGEIKNCLDGVHNGFVYEVTEEAKCEVNAIESATCTLCGETDEREVEGTALKHSFTKYEVTEEAECGKAGKEVAYCDHGCGATDEKEIPALTHKDEDGDYLCDHGCGHEFEKPAEPDTPDTPDEPTDEACDHLCHKDGLLGFFWKIACFFFRLFNIQQYCDCGELHYEKAIIG